MIVVPSSLLRCSRTTASNLRVPRTTIHVFLDGHLVYAFFLICELFIVLCVFFTSSASSVEATYLVSLHTALNDVGTGWSRRQW